MRRHGYQYVMGCASISMADGGHYASDVYHRLSVESLSPAEYRVFPRCELPLDEPPAAAPPLPPLIKGYVRLGAYVCGAPAWDPDFNTADLLMLLPMSRINARYARHFLKG
jgi:putative hemolysin